MRAPFQRRRGSLTLGFGLGLTHRPRLSPGAALQAAARAYYKFDADGSDSTSQGNNLTPVNSPTFAAGKVGSAAQLAAASSRYFVRTTLNGLDNLGSVWTWAWVNMTTKTGANEIIVQVSNEGSAQNIITISYNNASDRYQVQVRNAADSSSYTMNANTFGAVPLSTWTFVAGGYDAAGQVAWISVNNGTRDTVAATAGIVQMVGPKGWVGANRTPAAFWDGALDEIGIALGVPSAGDLAYLYNGGAGRSLF